MEFATERLVIRDWRAELAGDLRATAIRDVTGLLTPTVLTHLPPAVQDLGQGVPAWIARQQRLAQGLIIRCRAEDAFVGLALLYRSEGAIHLGYLLSERYWGLGLATEMLRGLVEALRTAAPVVLKAGVSRDNPASARVLEKVGFAPDLSVDGNEILRFSLAL